MKRLLLPIALASALQTAPLFGQKLDKAFADNVPTDIARVSPRPYDYQKNARYKGVEKRSLYITMRDGVNLAADIYLPRNRQDGERFPVILHQTRYWRSPQLKFPFSLFSNGLLGQTGKMVEAFVENGYVVVNVDVRGSGASLGVQPHPWSPEEVKDGAEIIDWILKQEWAGQNIGSLGASYSGTAAEFLATNRHPNLKAIIVMYALFDIYQDNAFPGGMHNVWFTSNWGDANDAMDANELPANYKRYKMIIKGVSPVKTQKRRRHLKEAVCDHAVNGNVHDGAMLVDFRDDEPESGMPPVDQFSPHRHVQQLDASGVAVYSYSGWHDGAYQNAAIARHLNLNNPHNKLTLGPWEHGGKFNISPFCRSLAGFNHAAEFLKFFDYHLKGIQNGLYDEPRVHYFTLGREEWQGSDVWPPQNPTWQTFHLDGQNHQLSANAPSRPSVDTMRINNFSGSGDFTRWKAVNGKIVQPNTYLDWTLRSRKLLGFETAALTADIEMTGHPIITLNLASSTPDGSVFVYLEDIDPQGNIHHITEGELRLSHRAELPKHVLFEDMRVPRSHLRADASCLQPGEWATVNIDLLAVSHRFKKGHKIRVSLAGADKDHFEAVNPQGYSLFFQHGGAAVSKLTLPTYEDGKLKN